MREEITAINTKLAVMDEHNKAIIDRFGKVEGAITTLTAHLASVLEADHKLIAAYIKVYPSSPTGPASASPSQTCDSPSPTSPMESVKTSKPIPAKQLGKPGVRPTPSFQSS